MTHRRFARSELNATSQGRLKINEWIMIWLSQLRDALAQLDEASSTLGDNLPDANDLTVPIYDVVAFVGRLRRVDAELRRACDGDDLYGKAIARLDTHPEWIGIAWSVVNVDEWASAVARLHASFDDPLLDAELLVEEAIDLFEAFDDARLIALLADERGHALITPAGDELDRAYRNLVHYGPSFVPAGVYLQSVLAAVADDLPPAWEQTLVAHNHVLDLLAEDERWGRFVVPESDDSSFVEPPRKSGESRFSPPLRALAAATTDAKGRAPLVWASPDQGYEAVLVLPRRMDETTVLEIVFTSMRYRGEPLISLPVFLGGLRLEMDGESKVQVAGDDVWAVREFLTCLVVGNSTWKPRFDDADVSSLFNAGESDSDPISET